MNLNGRLKKTKSFSLSTITVISLASFSMSGIAAPCQEGAINFNENHLAPYQTYSAASYYEVVDEGCSLYVSGNTYIITDQVLDITPNTVLNFNYLFSYIGDDYSPDASAYAQGIILLPEDAEANDISPDSHPAYYISLASNTHDFTDGSVSNGDYPYYKFYNNIHSYHPFNASFNESGANTHHTPEIAVGKNPKNIGKRRLAIFNRYQSDTAHFELDTLTAYYSNFTLSESLDSLHEDLEETAQGTCHKFTQLKTRFSGQPAPAPTIAINRVIQEATIVEDNCGIYISSGDKSVEDYSAEYTLYPDTLISFYFQTTIDSAEISAMLNDTPDLDFAHLSYSFHTGIGLRTNKNPISAIPVHSLSGAMTDRIDDPKYTNIISRSPFIVHVKDYPIGQHSAEALKNLPIDNTRINITHGRDSKSLYSQIRFRRAGWWKDNESKPPQEDTLPRAEVFYGYADEEPQP